MREEGEEEDKEEGDEEEEEEEEEERNEGRKESNGWLGFGFILTAIIIDTLRPPPRSVDKQNCVIPVNWAFFFFSFLMEKLNRRFLVSAD